MNRGRYTKHTREEANRIARMRQQGLSWELITQRTGMSRRSCCDIIKRLAR